MTQICNFAAEITFYVCGMDLNTLITRLEQDAVLANEWFEKKK